MDKFYFILFTSIVILAMIGCNSNNEMTAKKYSLTIGIDTTLEVPIHLHNFDSYSDLSARIAAIKCNDSIPLITIRNNNSQIKQVEPLNPCWETTACMLIRSHNVLKIKDDQIHLDRLISLDSLESIMHRHYYNYRMSPLHSDHPQKALISIDYKEKGIENLPNLLNRITDCFDRIGNDNPLVIQFKEYNPPPPPPINE